MLTLGPYELDRIHVGDSRELATRIPDASVGMIFSDPVYWQIEDYAWLAALAERVLVPGGNVIMQTVSMYRVEAERAIEDAAPGLLRLPLLVETLDFSARLRGARVFQSYKPHLWYAKAETVARRRGGWVRDQQHGGGKEKGFHEWQDSPRVYLSYIARLSSPGDVIFDPFMGGGTTAVATIMAGDRHWLGFEIDSDRAARAEERIASAHPVLLGYEEQLALIGEDAVVDVDGWPCDEDVDRVTQW